MHLNKEKIFRGLLKPNKEATFHEALFQIFHHPEPERPPWALHTGLTRTRKSYRDSCWQFGYQALTGLGWLKNHVKVMGEREILNKSYKFS